MSVSVELEGQIVEIVTLTLGIVAIVVSLVTLALTWRWSAEGQGALDEAKRTLREIDVASARIEKSTDEIASKVEQRLSDLISRAAPSVSEKAEADMMTAVMTNMMSSPDGVKMIMDLAAGQEKEKKRKR